jgi:hypothetical protein
MRRKAEKISKPRIFFGAFFRAVAKNFSGFSYFCGNTPGQVICFTKQKV